MMSIPVEEIKDITAKNIKYLVDLDRLSQDKWGSIFGLKKGQVSSYVLKKAVIPMEYALKVVEYYGISMEDFTTKDVSELNVSFTKGLRSMAQTAKVDETVTTPSTNRNDKDVKSMSREEMVKEIIKLRIERDDLEGKLDSTQKAKQILMDTLERTFKEL